MATNLREVCWEIYVNGEYYCSDSRWVPDEDVDVEFEITNAVYDLIGIDPANSQIHVEVQAVTDDDAMSVGYSALEGTVVQLDVKNDAIVCECGAKEKKLEGLADPAGPSPEVAGSSSGRDASPETPENCPTESTKSWKNSIGGFFKWLFWMDPAVPEPVCVADASPSEPTSDLDLVDTEKSSVPEPEPELDLVDPGESSDSDPEPELDGYDADESSVPDPNSSEPLGQGGMDASSGTPEENSPKKSTKVKKKKKNKICAFLKKLFTEDLVIPEEPSDPEPEPDLDLAVADESSVPARSSSEPLESTKLKKKKKKKKISAFLKKLFTEDLVIPEEPSDPKPEPDLDLAVADESSVPARSSSEPLESTKLKKKKKKISAFLKKLFTEDLVIPEEPSDPEPEPDLDLAVADESSVPARSSSEPLESTKLKKKKKKKISAFLKKLFTEDLVIPEEPSDPEPEPDLDLAVADESSVPAQSSSEPLESTKLKKKKKISAFLKKLFTEDLVIPEELSDPEPEPELDLGDPEKPSDPEQASEMDPHYSEQSVHTDSSFLYPDLHVVDSCYLLQLLQEPESFWYLFDSDDSCVPGPSSFVPKTFKQDPFNECFQLEELVKGCTVPYKDVTQVWTNIFIGNEEIARDRMRLKELGITHILNAAAVKKKLRILLGMPWEKDLRDTVNTGASYYRGMKISYCGLPTTRGSNISKYFLPAAEFIHKARQNSENKVFIHCTDGVSNAPALFLAYLMIHQYKTLENAIDYLINVRYIEPETEFLRQLAVLNTELEMNYH